MTVLMLSGVLTVALSSASLVVSRLVANRTQTYSTKAFFASEAGVERSLWELRKNNFDFSGCADQGECLDFSNGGCADCDNTEVILGNEVVYNVKYASSSPDSIFISDGKYFDIRRTVEVIF